MDNAQECKIRLKFQNLGLIGNVKISKITLPNWGKNLKVEPSNLEKRKSVNLLNTFKKTISRKKN